jgi:hypothetical protein
MCVFVVPIFLQVISYLNEEVNKYQLGGGMALTTTAASFHQQHDSQHQQHHYGASSSSRRHTVTPPAATGSSSSADYAQHYYQHHDNDHDHDQHQQHQHQHSASYVQPNRVSAGAPSDPMEEDVYMKGIHNLGLDAGAVAAAGIDLDWVKSLHSTTRIGAGTGTKGGKGVKDAYLLGTGESREFGSFSGRSGLADVTGAEEFDLENLDYYSLSTDTKRISGAGEK